MTLRTRLRSAVYRHIGGTAVVLIYHRVAVLERDPQLLAVTPERFDAQMRVLGQEYRVISLPELIEACRRRAIPERTVAVTFDDGYADNLVNAVPVLERHRVPATVFVSSGYVGAKHEFWWDEVERLLLGATSLPSTLILDAAGERLEVSLAEEGVRTQEDAGRDLGWNVLEASDSPRHRAYSDICSFIRPLSVASRMEVLRQLREVAGEPQAVRETHRPLSVDEVVRLDASSLVGVGAHTANHTRLSARPAGEQRQEVFADKATLEGILGRRLTEFSYPYGAVEDYSAESVDLVQEAGFAGACSNHSGVVKPWTDHYRIPRNVVRNWDAATFSAKLEGWFDDPR